jgi:hypothetical protein
MAQRNNNTSHKTRREFMKNSGVTTTILGLSSFASKRTVRFGFYWLWESSR